MPIYGVTIKGRSKRLLVKEASQAQAVAHFATAKALTAEEMQDAIENDERLWKPGQPLPSDGDPVKVDLDELDPPVGQITDTAD